MVSVKYLSRFLVDCILKYQFSVSMTLPPGPLLAPVSPYLFIDKKNILCLVYQLINPNWYVCSRIHIKGVSQIIIFIQLHKFNHKILTFPIFSCSMDP